MKKEESIYSMRTLSQQEMITKHSKIKIMIILIILLFLLIFMLNQVVKNIQVQKQIKRYENQVIAYDEQQRKIAEEKNRIEEEKRKENLVQVTEKGKENLKTIYHSETKRAFLTFDDGPSTVTPTILQTLNEKGVKATFFVLGSNAEHMPDMVKQMYEQGHYIANHGYSHVYSTIYSSPEMVLEEFNKTNGIVQNAIGDSNFNSHLFRFPGGYVGGKYADIKKQAKELLNQNDIYNVDWNCLSGDAETSSPTPEYIMKRIQETSNGKNSLVILMHDAQAKKVTAEKLPEIIDYLAGQGYEFKTFYDIFEK